MVKKGFEQFIKGIVQAPVKKQNKSSKSDTRSDKADKNNKHDKQNKKWESQQISGDADLLKLLTGGSSHETPNQQNQMTENDKNRNTFQNGRSDESTVTPGVGLGVDSSMPGAAMHISTAAQINQLKKRYGNAKNQL